MGTVSSLAIRLEDLLAHLLRGEPPGYELACPPYWDDDEGPGLVVVLKPNGSKSAHTLADEEVEGPIRALLRNHHSVIFGDSPVGTVEIQGVAVGRKWEKRPQYAGWILVVFKTASNDNLGFEQDNVVHVSFGPRG